VIEAINRAGGEPFTSVEADLLTVIAQQAALFLENARLYGELQQRVDFANAELRETNQQLASEKARVDTLLREMASGVLATDEAERIILVNDLAETMLGLRQETALGQSIAAAVRERRVQEMFAAPLLEGGFLVQELELPTGSGTVVRAHLTAFELSGTAIGKCLLLTDVTQFVELDEMKTDLISFVSHELKNPLAALLAFINLMQHNPGAQVEPISRYVTQVRQQAAHMQELVQSYLNVARLEAGRELEMDREELADVGAYVQELVATHAPTWEREIDVDIPPDLPPLWVDGQAFREMLLNLVGNAVKYTPRDTPITVEARAEEGWVRFAVIDRGPGLDEAAQGHLFEKFRRFRGSNQERVPGTGIGLYLSKHLVEAHGGRIWVESQPGQGATFRFTLPTGRPSVT
jgi:PAS domain S-box-containing protein